MSIFLTLVLAHFIADFPLQTNLLFQLKIKSIAGVIIHASVFFSVALLLLIPLIPSWFLISILLLLTLLHALVDQTKVFLVQEKYQDNIWFFLLDQLIHIGCLGLGTMVLLYAPLGLQAFSYNTNLIISSTRILLILIGLLVSTYAGIIFVYYMDRTITTRTGPSSAFSTKGKYYGVLARFCITSTILSGGLYALLLTPVAIIIHFLLWLKVEKKWPVFIVQYLSSVILALMIGVWLNLVIKT